MKMKMKMDSKESKDGCTRSKDRTNIKINHDMNRVKNGLIL